MHSRKKHSFSFYDIINLFYVVLCCYVIRAMFIAINILTPIHVNLLCVSLKFFIYHKTYNSYELYRCISRVIEIKPIRDSKETVFFNYLFCLTFI